MEQRLNTESAVQFMTSKPGLYDVIIPPWDLLTPEEQARVCIGGAWPVLVICLGTWSDMRFAIVDVLARLIVNDMLATNQGVS